MAKIFNSSKETSPNSIVESGGDIRGALPWFDAPSIERPVMSTEERSNVNSIAPHNNESNWIDFRGRGKLRGICLYCLKNKFTTDPDATPTGVINSLNTEQLAEVKSCKGDEGVGFGQHRRSSLTQTGTVDPNEEPFELVFSNPQEALDHMLENSKQDKERFPIKLPEEPYGFEIGIDTTPKQIKRRTRRAFNSSRISSYYDSTGLPSDQIDLDNPEVLESLHIDPPAETANDESSWSESTEGHNDETALVKLIKSQNCQHCHGLGCKKCLGDIEIENDDTGHDGEHDLEDEDELTESEATGETESSKITCPKPPLGCGGMSQFNKPENRIFEETHCGSCNGNCGSSSSDPSAHCIGHIETGNCKGRKKYEWTAKDGKTKVCPICNNEGEIDQDLNDALQAGSVTPTQIKKVKKEFEKKNKSELPSKPISFDEDNEDDYEIGTGSVPTLGELPEAPEAPRPNSVEMHSALSSFIKELAPSGSTTNGIETNTLPKPGEVATHNNCGCDKRNGLASDKKIEEIMANRSTNGYDEGMRNIFESTSDPEKRKEKQNEFIKQQYACKGDGQ